MPAPDSTLLAALRAGTAARHIFFRLEHSQGDVLAWDGIGQFDYDGETYLGVAGYATVSGISDSADIQNHAIEVRLNGVPRSGMVDIDPTISDDPAQIFAVWIDESGAVVADKLLFDGSGNVMKIATSDNDFTIIARLKGKMADWAFVARSYYTSTDQQRIFAGDTGCSQTEFLENASISGWQPGETESALFWYWDNGATKYSTYPYPPDFVADAEDNVPVGNHTYGLSTRVDGGKLWATALTHKYADIVTTTEVDVGSLGAALTIGGNTCFVDSSGDVRSPAGNLIASANSLTSTYRLRRPGVIASIGTATATEFDYGFGMGTSGLVTAFKKVGGTTSGNNMSGLVFENGGSAGIPVATLGSGTSFTITNSQTGEQYVNETSGGFLRYNGPADRLRDTVTGADCVLSDTGVVLGSTGGRFHRVGGIVGVDFLRVWT